LVARLVLKAFVGEPPTDKPLALHGNDDPTDNRVVNLRWGDSTENLEDARRNGKYPPLLKIPCPHCEQAVAVVRKGNNVFELRGGASS
jgi:hypothetical protein